MEREDSPFATEDELNSQYNRSHGELNNVVGDGVTEVGAAVIPSRCPLDQSRNRSHTTQSAAHYNITKRPRPAIRNLRIANTPHFYDSGEQTVHEEAPAHTSERQKYKQSKHLPGWIWRIIILVLGINRSTKFFARFIYALTILSALAFTGLGVVFVAYDIGSKNSKTTAHIGFISLLIGFAWLSLGIYSFTLAQRLFGDDVFAASIRGHSRTLFKISSAGLLVVSGLAFTGLNLYSAFITFSADHCNVIGLFHFVCPAMYLSRAVFSILGTSWNLMVGCMLLSVCRTHTIGIRRFLRDLEQDGKMYENYWKQKLQKSKSGEFSRETSSILNNWFILEENDPILAEMISAEPSVTPPLAQSRTGPEVDTGRAIHTDDVVLMRPQDDLANTPPTRILQNQESTETVGSSTDLHDEPPIMTEDELLLCYWKISSRMRFTSRCLQRWLASWIAFVAVWCADYVIYWLSHSPNILAIMEFVAPMVLLLIICSAYAEANGEGQTMIRCICPTKDRYGLLSFLNIQPLQMQVFNLSISYSAILTVILAFSVAFSSRLILDEVMKT